MALTRDNGTITSDRTPHSARLIDGSRDHWKVSYLPGLSMDYDEACTALEIAERPFPGDSSAPLRDWDRQDIRAWIRQELWAQYLDVDIDDVRRRVSHQPAWTAGDRWQQPRRQAEEAAAERDELEAGG
jgi:hypothetical protein